MVYPLVIAVLLFILTGCSGTAKTVDVIKNGSFSAWSRGDGSAPDGWSLGGKATGSVSRDRSETTAGNTGARVVMASGEALMMYQDINKFEKYRGKDFSIGCWIKTEKADSVSVDLHDGITWQKSPPHTGSGLWEYLNVRGTIAKNATRLRIHLTARHNVQATFEGVSFKVGPGGSFEGGMHGIEYVLWPGLYDTKIYKSRKTNMSMAFGAKQIMEGYIYQNFFTYDHTKLEDYFCIPDDLIIGYDNKSSFVSRIFSLNWKLEHGLSNEGQKAFVRYIFHEGDGFNPPYLKNNFFNSASAPPPASVTLEHTMDYAENFVPMKIAIKNTFKRPLRFLYVFQDGAYMTDADQKNLANVHQYWDDGEYTYARVWKIDNSTRKNKNNWMGMYNDRNGGMFAGTYAPPESKGIRYHATWDNAKPAPPGKERVAFLDLYGSPGLHFWRDDWYRYEKLLKHVDTPNKANPYDNPTGKIHGTVIDFGTIPPGEERIQVVVKIMFTGYKNRADMHRRVREIIERIPPFDIPPYDLAR